MNQLDDLRNRLSQINENNFDDIALEVFKLQARDNEVYARFLSLSGVNPHQVNATEEIPFLPIQFFKTHAIKTGEWKEEKKFRSSGTTATGFSFHAIKSLRFYLDHAARCYEEVFGPLEDTHFLAVLPSYIERDNASLVAMADYFIKKSGSDLSGFYLEDSKRLRLVIDLALKTGKPVMLLGVTFALLDLVQSNFDFSGIRIMETGGMKGRRKELIREEVHRLLKSGNPLGVCSEYGMTEMLSQAYSRSGSVYQPSRLLKIIVKEINDHRAIASPGTTGIINVMDLANLDTCAFIETQDLGRLVSGGFEVLGRLDNSDVRGCSLLTS